MHRGFARVSRLGFRRPSGSNPPDVLLWTGVPIAIGLGLSAWLPVELVLPIVSVVLLVAALGLALVAETSPERSDAGQLTFWDLSGFLAFLGIAAGLLADPEDVLPLLQHEGFGLNSRRARH